MFLGSGRVLDTVARLGNSIQMTAGRARVAGSASEEGIDSKARKGAEAIGDRVAVLRSPMAFIHPFRVLQGWPWD